uniref:Uncharacterized protein n=1 Tax=Catharus ustulatus TaxID=91951 RepID=A0A8C3UUC9_CATUS
MGTAGDSWGQLGTSGGYLGVPRGSHLDARAPALAHGVGYGGAGGVDHGHEPHEAQIGRGEIQLVRIEPEPAGKLVRGRNFCIQVTESWGHEGTGGAAPPGITRSPRM